MIKKIIIILVVIAVTSCKNEVTIDYAIVSGIILNTKASELSISSSDRKINKILKIDSEGKFMDTIVLSSTFLEFYDGKNFNKFYAEAGNNIVINYDAKNFENSLKYSGIGSQVSNYLMQKDKLNNELTGDRKSFYSLDEEAFKTKAKNIQISLEALILSTEGISASFKAKEKKDIFYQYLSNLGAYEGSHSYYIKNKDFKVSEDFLKEQAGLDYNSEEDFLFSSNYQNLVSSHYRKLSNELIKTDSINRAMAYMKVLGTVTNQTIKNQLSFEDASYSIKYVDNIQSYYDLFISNSTNEENNTKIFEIYNNLKKLATGSPSPKFMNYENHAGGRTSLDELKGKYIYIDVWATWCGPCKAEIPYLKKLEEKYHDRNIHFVSLSVDNAKDHDKWSKMVTDEGLGGIQLIADDAWKSTFVRDYLIDGIPHFILLNPAGEIVKYSAPRPSDSKLIELFDALNI